MTKHTPGPWTLKESGDGKWIQIYGNGAEPHQNIAEVRRDDFISVEEDGDEPTYNAALIAAAPETAAERDRLKEINAGLLGALKEIVIKLNTDLPVSCGPDEIHKIAETAIAKAEAA